MERINGILSKNLGLKPHHFRLCGGMVVGARRGQGKQTERKIIRRSAGAFRWGWKVAYHRLPYL
jgi:hypothetical protein